MLPALVESTKAGMKTVTDRITRQATQNLKLHGFESMGQVMWWTGLKGKTVEIENTKLRRCSVDSNNLRIFGYSTTGEESEELYKSLDKDHSGRKKLASFWQSMWIDGKIITGLRSQKSTPCSHVLRAASEGRGDSSPGTSGLP